MVCTRVYIQQGSANSGEGNEPHKELHKQALYALVSILIVTPKEIVSRTMMRITRVTNMHDQKDVDR